MLIAVILGTSLLVNAKTTPTKLMVAKEVNTPKRHKTKEGKKKQKQNKKLLKNRKSCHCQRQKVKEENCLKKASKEI